MTPAPTHKCAATACKRQIPQKYLMCGKHWFMVPQGIQTEVWRTYHDGQRKKTHPTDEYLAAVEKAVYAVASQQKLTGASK